MRSHDVDFVSVLFVTWYRRDHRAFQHKHRSPNFAWLQLACCSTVIVNPPPRLGARVVVSLPAAESWSGLVDCECFALNAFFFLSSLRPRLDHYFTSFNFNWQSVANVCACASNVSSSCVRSRCSDCKVTKWYISAISPGGGGGCMFLSYVRIS